MSNHFDYKKESFFLEYEEKNSILILLYIIFSLTSYVVYWFYKVNIVLEAIDDDAPNSDRAVSVLLILPSLWFLLTYLLKKYVFDVDSNYLLRIYWNPVLVNLNSNQILIGSVEIIVWFLILILILKYIYDFSVSFARVTKTYFFVWYVFLVSEVFGFVFLLFGLDKLFLISFLTIVIVPAMQEKLNLISEKYKINSQKKMNYMFGSNN